MRSTASLARAVDPFQKVLPRNPAEISVTQRRLLLAGYRKEMHVDIFYGAKGAHHDDSGGPGSGDYGVYDMGPFFVYALAVGLG